MNNKQREIINKIVKERKEIKLLKEKLEHLENDYYDDLLKLYNSVDILGKEQEIAKTEIISIQDYKLKRIKRNKDENKIF